ncbi:MAG: hypothetical protein KGL39_14175 [Patescibacteria group bacterium]|nr:hypothetical protein [Patescibacteria group bacterium]
MLKKLTISLGLLALLAVPAGAAQYNGSIFASASNCSTVQACVTANLSGAPGKADASATITLSGTFSATLQFEVSADGGNTWSSVGSASSVGATTVSVASNQFLRVRCSAYTSGTVSVTINTSTANGLPSAIQDKGGQVFNVRAYGAKGDGSTDDTAAIQAVINLFSGQGTNNCTSGAVLLSQGTYDISSTLVYYGGSSCALLLEGAPQAARGDTGAVIKWTGATHVPMFVSMGGNQVRLQNITLDTNSVASSGAVITADNVYSGTLSQAITTIGSQTVSVSSTTNITTGTWIHVDSGSSFEVVQVTGTGTGTITANFQKTHLNGAAYGGGPGSSGTYFQHDTVLNESYTNGVGVYIGNATGGSTPQVDTIHFFNTLVRGSSTAYAGVQTSGGGNIKQFFFRGGSVTGFQYGFYIGNSAETAISDVDFAGDTVASIYNNNASPMLVSGCELEEGTGAVFVSGPGISSSAFRLTMINNHWNINPPSASPIIQWNGPMILMGNEFGPINSANPAYLNDPAIFYHNVAIVSIGNYYGGTVAGVVPIYRTGTTELANNVTSLGDIGGNGNLSSGVRLTDILTLQGVAFSKVTACSANYAGMIAHFTDSTTNTWGATITGGGADDVEGRCNGTAWTVVGK